MRNLFRVIADLREQGGFADKFVKKAGNSSPSNGSEDEPEADEEASASEASDEKGEEEGEPEGEEEEEDEPKGDETGEIEAEVEVVHEPKAQVANEKGASSRSRQDASDDDIVFVSDKPVPARKTMVDLAQQLVALQNKIGQLKKRS